MQFAGGGSGEDRDDRVFGGVRFAAVWGLRCESTVPGFTV